jgi:fumarate reductase subunit C
MSRMVIALSFHEMMLIVLWTRFVWMMQNPLSVIISLVILAVLFLFTGVMDD